MKIIYPLFLSALLTQVYAQEDHNHESRILSLEELMNVTLISSTGTEKRLSEAPSIATVITAEQIERSSARTLDEVLQMVPGMQVYLSPVDIQKNSYDIRGIRSDTNPQILTLINGVSIDILGNGTTVQRFTYPASAIKRVEVIRGPGSAVYGADAFSGVINIITKDAAYLSDNSQVGVRYGSFDTAEVYGNYGEIYDSGLELGLNLSYLTSNGDRDRTIEADLQTGIDAIFSTNASQAPGAYDDRYEVYNMNLNLNYENLSVNLWAYLSKDMGVGAGAANALDQDGSNEDNQFVADLNYDSQLMQDVKWNNKLTLSYLDNKNEFNLLPPGTVVPIGSDGNLFTPGGGIVAFPNGVIGHPETEDTKVAYESTLNLSSFEDQEIRLSIGYSYAKSDTQEKKNFGPGILDGTEGVVNGILTDVSGTPYVYREDEDRKIFFLSAQDEYKLAQDWQLTAGIRYDHYSDFGDTVNPRVGLVWNTSEDFTTKILYGRAFRAPSFTELYAQNNPASVGNDDLDPETIDMIELGSSFQPNSKLNTSLNIYWYEINDLIQGVPSAIGVRSENIGRQHGAGVELEASYQVTNDLFFMVDYAYRWTKNKRTDEAVANVPKHIGHAMFDWSFMKNWYLGSEVYMVADTPREEGDIRNKIASYRTVNASIGHSFYEGLEVSVAVRNLFDKKYYDPSNTNPVNDYPMEGLNVFGELRYRF